MREGRRKKAVGGTQGCHRVGIFFAAYCLLPTAYSLAITQEDVFKSIHENVSNSGEGSGKMFLALVLGMVAVLLLLVLLGLRHRRVAAPRAVNHPGKLLKELAKKVSLRRVEMKQLKMLADAERRAGNPIDSPLVFLLCPSALAAAMRAGRVKVDRKVIAGIAMKMGLITRK